MSRSKPRREKGPTYLDACLSPSPPLPQLPRAISPPPLPRLCYFNFRSVYRFPFVYLPAMRAPRWLRSHHFVNIVSRAKTRMSLCHAPPPHFFHRWKLLEWSTEGGWVESNRIESVGVIANGSRIRCWPSRSMIVKSSNEPYGGTNWYNRALECALLTYLLTYIFHSSEIIRRRSWMIRTRSKSSSLPLARNPSLHYFLSPVFG